MADVDPYAGLTPEERALLEGSSQPATAAPAQPQSTTQPASPDPYAGLTPEERKLLEPQTTTETTKTTTTPPASTTGPFGLQEPDWAKAFGAGAYRGFGDVAQGVNRLAGTVGIPSFVPSTWGRDLTPDEQAAIVNNPIAAGAGRVVGQTATAGLPAAGVGAGIGAAAGALGAGSVVGGALSGAGAGAAQNLLTSGEAPDESLTRRALLGAGLGAATGGVGGYLSDAFGAGKTVASQAVIDAGNTARSAGIDVLPENLPLAGTAAGARGAQATPAQIGQVNRAFGNLVGGNVSDFSAATLGGQNGLTNTIGRQISSAVNQGQVQMTPQLETQLQTILQNANAPGIDPLVTAKIEHEVDKVLTMAPNIGDTVTGSQFDHLIGDGSKLSNYTGDANKDLAGLAQQLDGTLDSAFQASSPPGVYRQYVDAKTRFRLLKAIEDNVEADPAGNIKPGTIMADINRRFPNMPNQTAATGGTVGQAADLARSVTTLFGSGSFNPGVAGGAGRGAFLGAGLGTALAPYAMDLIKNPSDIAALSSYLTTHPVALAAGAGGIGLEGLAYLGRLYQQSRPFANALLQRGPRVGPNWLTPYLGATAATLPSASQSGSQ